MCYDVDDAFWHEYCYSVDEIAQDWAQRKDQQPKNQPQAPDPPSKGHADEDEALPKYTYPRLPERSIRLLRIRDNDSRNAPIRIDLEVYSLDSAPEFAALSYTWGAADYHGIVCDSSGFIFVRTNLLDALQAIRAADKGLLLWVDQITIDQENSEEKSEQVKLMGRIFSQAHTVFVWLSQAIWADTHLSSNLPLVYEDYWKRIKKAKETGRRAEPRLGPDVGDDGPVLAHQHWPSLSRLFSHTYWTRVWVVQELIRARNLSFMVGGKAFDFAALAITVVGIRTWGGEGMQRGISTPLSHAVECFATIERLLTYMRPDWSSSVAVRLADDSNTALLKAYAANGSIYSTQTVWSLSDLILQTWEFSATDDRDKVYSLLGLLDLPCCNNQSVDVAYEDVSYSSLLIRTFHDSLARPLRAKLEQLCYIKPPPASTGEAKDKTFDEAHWPSWVPNPQIQEAVFYPSGLAREHASFAANGDLPACVRSIPGRDAALSFKIRVFVVVEEIPSLEAAQHEAELIGIKESDVQLCQSDKLRHHETLERSVLWTYFKVKLATALILTNWTQTLAASSLSIDELNARIDEFINAFLCGFKFDARTSLTTNTRDHGAQILVDWIKTLIYCHKHRFIGSLVARYKERHILRNESIWDPLSAFLNRTHGLQICRVRETHPTGDSTGAINAWGRMAWVLEGVKPGDEVCIVHGLKMPMVIRKREEKEYAFMGVCYVYGYMHGEALGNDALHDDFVTMV